MGRSQDDPKADYRYDFFKTIYSGKRHYTVDYYGKQVDGKIHFYTELQSFPEGEKEILAIQENATGDFEIVSEVSISEDLRRIILNLIKEHSKYYGNK